jgi:hypothetical protein
VDVPEVLSRPQLRAAGFSDAELRQQLRTGDLTSVRRGSYLRGAPPTEADLRHAVAVRAAVDRLGPGSVVSHVSAAVLHGLPVWRIPLRRVHLTRSRGRSGSRANALVHVHSAALAVEETCRVAGFAVTSLARTVLDLARSVPFEEAVVVADAALRAQPDHREPLAPAALSAALARAARWPGTPAARRVIGFADGRSGSVGESRSRVAIAAAGLPAPVLQWEVRDRAGRLVGYTDFGWPEHRTVGEFDGRVKYGRLLQPGQDPGDAVYAEKLREDRLRDLGLSVVRWTWPELHDFAPVADRLRRRLQHDRAHPV